MTYLSLLFWLALVIPGYAVVCHLDRAQLKSGFLGTLGLSYAATLGLLAPISILCYLWSLPLAVFSSVCVLLVLAGAIEITRKRWWHDAHKLIVGAFGIELLILVIDMVMGARAGAMLGGDARVHLARIRFLLDHGLSNLDPFCAVPYFYPIYHTNLLHALYAAAAQLTGGDHLLAWHVSLPWGKLLTASGVYYLVWSVFGRRWPAWVAVVFAVGVSGPVTFTIYPNKLAPYWLAPYMIGFAIQACRTECSRRTCVQLAAGALVLGQIHGLYALYTVGIIAPVVGVRFLTHLLRRKPDRWRLATCILALSLALPFPLISKLKSRAPDSSVQEVQAADRTSAGFVEFANGWVMRDPMCGFGGGGPWSLPVLGAGIICALAGSRRREAAISLAIIGVVAAVYYVPPLCSAVLNFVGEEWILIRLGFVLRLGFFIFGPGVLAFVLLPKARHWWVQTLLSLLAFAAAFPYAGHNKPHDWQTYGMIARRQRLGQVKRYGELRRFLEKQVPAGNTVLTDSREGMLLVMLHDCYVVASASSSLGIADLPQRRKDLEAMLSDETGWELRRQLFRSYDIEYYYPGQARPKWVEAHWKDLIREGRFVLVRLDVD